MYEMLSNDYFYHTHVFFYLHEISIDECVFTIYTYIYSGEKAIKLCGILELKIN